MILWTHDRFDERHFAAMREEWNEEIVVKDLSAVSVQEKQNAEIAVAWGPAIAALSSGDFRQFENLKWLHILNAGVEMLPFDLLRERGWIVTNSKGIHGTQISEQILGMMISFSRGLHVHLRNQMNGVWGSDYPYDELYGKTLCILGTGSIGRELARRAAAFDMRIIGVKKHVAELEHFDTVMDLGRLHEALRVSDYVVSLLPLTAETRHLIGQRELEVMKRSAVLLNYSRGDIVDEDALIRALETGAIRGAGLDVFREEPLPRDHALWKMNHVLISPHSSGFTPHLEEKLFALFKRMLHAYRSGAELPNRFNLLG